MRRAGVLLLVMLVVSSASCSSSEALITQCTLELRVALSVALTDAQGNALTTGVSVMALRNGSSEGVQASWQSPVTWFTGGPGVYDVTADAAGYLTATSRVTVPAEDAVCMKPVRTSITIPLTRKP